MNVESNPTYYAHKIYLKGKEINDLIIPAGVTEIKIGNFINCNRIGTVSFPNSLKTIGIHAFSGCTSLEEINFGKSPNLETIEEGAFYHCTSLREIELPNTVVNLGGAFWYCENLQTANIPIGVTEIGPRAFQECKKLESINIPQNTTKIGNFAFYGCRALTRIDIPKTVEYIGTEAFCNCYGLQGVYIQDISAWCKIKYGNLQYQGSNWGPTERQSNPLIFAHNLYHNNELVTDLIVPGNVETIEANTFWGATCLKSVTIADGVKTIGERTFYSCRNICKIVLPSSIDSIGSSAFGVITANKVNLYISNLEKWICNNCGKSLYEISNGVDLYLKGTQITDLVIPETINKLSGLVFPYMRFNSVTLPSSLEKMEAGLSHASNFDYSTIQIIYSKPRFAPSGGSAKLFGRIKGLETIYVLEGRGYNYTSVWSGHSDIIKEVPNKLVFEGKQTASMIADVKKAYKYLYDRDYTFLNLINAILDESITITNLKEGDANPNTLYYLPSVSSNIRGDNIIIDGKTENVVIIDQKDFFAPIQFEANSVRYNRLFNASTTDAFTLCVPYDLKTLPDGIKVYTMSGQDGNTIQFVETNQIKANKPYLITVNKTIDGLSTMNTTITATPEEMDDAGIIDYEFYGTLSQISNEDASNMGAYILQENKTWHSVSTEKPTAYITPGRAYIIPKNSIAKSFFTSLDGSDNNVDNIHYLQTTDSNGQNKYYDLNGHLIKEPQKGVIIRNKQKYIIK